MGISAVLESLDDVQESVKSLYKRDEEHDIYVLDIDGIDDHPKVRGVITANKTNKETRDKFKARAEELEARLKNIPEDFDPEAYADLKERLEKGQGPDLDERLAKQRAKLEETFKAQIAEKEGQINSLTSGLHRMVIDGGIDAGMDAAGIDPKHKSMLKPFLKSLAPITVETDGDMFKASVDTDLGSVDLGKFVSEWAAGDGKVYQAKPNGPRPRGGDGQGGSGAVTRAEFDAMSHSERASVAKNGVKVVD